MPTDITIPSPGESITEVTIGPWHKQDGDVVEKDETLVEIESDKVTLEIPAPESGVLSISAPEGEEKKVGDVIGSIDAGAKRAKPQASSRADRASKAETEDAEARTETKDRASAVAKENEQAKATSVARKIAADKGVNLAELQGSGPSGRITKGDVLAAVSRPSAPHPPSKEEGERAAGLSQIVRQAVQTSLDVHGDRPVRREKMSKLRQRIAERLVIAQHTAAMLTTFNEADMSEIMRLRSQHKESFYEKYEVNLGFMSFFVKAAAEALLQFPRVNAYLIDGEIEYHHFVDVSIAVGTDKGLVVPILRNAERMSFAQIEAAIKDFAVRARAGKLSLDEMTGGTFTISNGGVYGSLNSTPILNPPQSGILGMHAIKNRAVEDPAKPGNIVLRPMMYLAMSYDHRIVDGAEAVTFLVHIKNCIENPERMLLGL